MIFERFNFILKQFHSDYEVKEDFERNEIEYIILKKKEFSIGKANIFLNSHKTLILEDNKKCYEGLLRTFKSVKWKAQAEKDKYDIGDISKKTYGND